MALEMRELKGDDLFTLLSLVGKLNIKDEFINMFGGEEESTVKRPADKKAKQPTKAEQEAEDRRAEKRGLEIVANLAQKVLVNINIIKPEINGLLADLTGTSVKEIQELNLKDYTSLIVAFFKKPELKDFFSSIASLMQ